MVRILIAILFLLSTALFAGARVENSAKSEGAKKVLEQLRWFDDLKDGSISPEALEQALDNTPFGKYIELKLAKALQNQGAAGGGRKDMPKAAPEEEHRPMKWAPTSPFSN